MSDKKIIMESTPALTPATMTKVADSVRELIAVLRQEIEEQMRSYDPTKPSKGLTSRLSAVERLSDVLVKIEKLDGNTTKAIERLTKTLTRAYAQIAN